MPIAAFYENIRTGALEKGISMTEAASRLRESGMDGIYICLDSVREYPDEIEEVIRTTGVCVTGLHAWIDFGRNPEGYQELVDAAVRLKTDHVLIVPTCEGEEEPLPILLCGMRKAVLYGKDRGIRVFMEDLDQKDSLYNSLGGLQMFLSGVPGLFCCFDTGNFIMHQEDELEAAKLLRDFIFAMHLKDRTIVPENPDDIGKKILDGTLRYPVPVGSGYIKIREILNLVYDVPVIVELYDYSPSQMLEGIRRSVEWVSTYV